MNGFLFLFFYATMKAFLPLPSLEVVLIPLVITHPEYFVHYSFLGAIGTFFGGSIGYFFARIVKENVWISIFGTSTWEKGKALFQRYGIFAVIVGGITPIPDFILAYIAGFTRMNYLAFAISDGIARFFRSIILLYFFIQLGIMIDMDQYGTAFVAILISYFFVKYLIGFVKSKKV